MPAMDRCLRGVSAYLVSASFGEENSEHGHSTGGGMRPSATIRPIALQWGKLFSKSLE